MISYIALLVAGVLVGIDQLIKQWAVSSLTQVDSIVVIPGLFHLTYVENRGAAFGILQQRTFILVGVTSVVLIIGVVLLLLRKIRPPMLIWGVSLILAGGTGNLIDRIARGFVVDYLDFSSLFQFPVFNFADCCVVIGTAVVVIYVILTDEKRLLQKREQRRRNSQG